MNIAIWAFDFKPKKGVTQGFKPSLKEGVSKA